MIKESTVASGAYETAIADAPDYKAMYEAAAAESDKCYARMAEMRMKFASEIDDLKKEVEWHKRENEILEAQLYIVRLIFGGDKE